MFQSFARNGPHRPKRRTSPARQRMLKRSLGRKCSEGSSESAVRNGKRNIRSLRMRARYFRINQLLVSLPLMLLIFSLLCDCDAWAPPNRLNSISTARRFQSYANLERYQFMGRGQFGGPMRQQLMREKNLSILHQTANCEETEAEDSADSAKEQRLDLNLLIIDHYDSFTYNLYDMFAQSTTKSPTVVRKDDYDGWPGIGEGTQGGKAFYPHAEDLDGIVLSPGPGTPEEQPQFSKDAIEYARRHGIPLLGVCLGHQLLALMDSSKVSRAPEPIHGQVATVERVPGTKSAILPPDIATFEAVRYHSLAVRPPLDGWTVTATCPSDGTVQAMEHVAHPQFGVQFHPESIGSQPHGQDMLRAFCGVCEEKKMKKQVPKPENESRSRTNVDLGNANHSGPDRDLAAVKAAPITSKGNCRSAKNSVNELAIDKSTLENSALDGYSANTNKVNGISASNEMDVNGFNEPARSILSELDGISNSDQPSPRYDVYMHIVSNEHGADLEPENVFETFYMANPLSVWLDSASRGSISILSAACDDGDKIEYELGNEKDVFVWLSEQQGAAPTTEIHIISRDLSRIDRIVSETDDHAIPFDYRGGPVGYLGYEVRHRTESHLTGKPCNVPSGVARNGENPPAAAFFVAKRSMVYHHETRQWYLVSLVDRTTGESVEDAIEWMAETDRKMREMANDFSRKVESMHRLPPPRQTPAVFIPNRPKERYLRDIKDCHEYIKTGESYELCLTNQLEAEVLSASVSSSFGLYKKLRRRNPAPYAAFFRWGDSFAICSSSPERFLSVGRQKDGSLRVEAKPIKGTTARAPEDPVEDARLADELQWSTKNRAENLMIVDLLRNDLSRVCTVGSVHVSALMAIESFATVHQLVSTVRGTLRPAASCADLLLSAFPGGSMTGAPKLRTLELLNRLEDGVSRGPYAGSLGYLSVNGCMDFNIVIRTAVVTADKSSGSCRVRIGAGGAITALSDSEDEYDEMILKAAPVVSAVRAWASELPDSDAALFAGDRIRNATRVAVR